MSRTDVAEYLRKVADALDRSGEVNFNAGAQQTSVQAPDFVNFEVEVEQFIPDSETHSPEISIELEIEWYADEDSEMGPLDIS